MSTMSDIFSTVAPWLTAGLTGGPAGLAMQAASTIAQAIGLGSNAVTDVKTAVDSITLSATQQSALSQAEMDFQFKMKAAGYSDVEALSKMDIDQMAIVNATMVEELKNAASESWYQKSWRPACGFAVAVGSFAGVIGVALLSYQGIAQHDGNAIGAIPGLAMSMATILAVPGSAVGIAAWHRGQAERAEAAKG